MLRAFWRFVFGERVALLTTDTMWLSCILETGSGMKSRVIVDWNSAPSICLDASMERAQNGRSGRRAGAGVVDGPVMTSQADFINSQTVDPDRWV